MAQPFPALDVAGQTDVGLKRSRNEDSFTVLMPPAGSPQVSQGAMFIVADGMGGMGGGDVASKTAIEEIVKTFYDPSVTHDYDPLPRLRNALEAANVRVRETAQSVGLPRIGATGAGMILTSTGDAVVFNIGDSRVYRARGSYIELLTRDQSVMASQLEAGLVSQEEAKLSRNVNVTAFIGQPMPISPVYSRMQTQPGDVFIICSDGLWDLVEPNEILKAVQSPAKEAASKLIALVRQRGAPDNVTVIIVRVGMPARALPVRWLVVAGLIVLAAVGGFALARAGLFGDNRPAPTEIALATMTSAPPSATVPALVAATPEVTPAASQLISITLDTATPEVSLVAIASATTESPAETAAVVAALPTETNTPQSTSTRLASKAPSPTSTPTATSTANPTPTATATHAPSSTPTLTAMPAPSETPQPLPTTAPSATKPPEPTVTLNPTVITFTPAPRPTSFATAAAVSSASHDAFMLIVAQDGEVILSGGTTLYLFDDSATPEATVDALDYLGTHPASDVTATPEASAEATADITATAEVTAGAQVALDAGTHVQLLDDHAQPAPQGEGIVLHVSVTSGDHVGEIGWINLSALLQATPAIPYVLPASNVIKGVNVRSGEGQLSSVIDVLLPGEFARLVGISSSPLGWYYVELTSGGRGWVSPGNVTIEGDRSAVKRLLPPPTPTFTPSPTDTPVPLPTLTSVGAG